MWEFIKKKKKKAWSAQGNQLCSTPLKATYCDMSAYAYGQISFLAGLLIKIVAINRMSVHSKWTSRDIFQVFNNGHACLLYANVDMI